MSNITTSLTNVKTFLTQQNTKMIIVYVFGLLILIAILYYCYIKYIAPKFKELYKPNKEQLPLFAGSNSSGGSNQNDAELYLFTANWCPYCKAAAPEWNSVKTEYENKLINGYKVIFIEVNCTTSNAENDHLMDKFNVEGFPTIKLLKNGQIISYDAKVTSAHLTQFLNTAL